MTVMTIGWIAFGLSLAGLLLAQVMYARDNYWLRRHSSRFEMFAVRDRLVELVCDGEMEEDDIAWFATYLTANSLLEFNKTHSVWSELRSFIQHSRSMKNNQKRRNHVKAIQLAIETRAKENEDFAKALMDLSRASNRMMRGQVHWWDVLALSALAVIFTVLVRIVRPFARKRVEQVDGSPMQPDPSSSMTMTQRRPLDWYRGISPRSTNDLVGWRNDMHNRRRAPI